LIKLIKDIYPLIKKVKIEEDGTALIGYSHRLSSEEIGIIN
jgi:hypothetical protein